MKHIIDHHLTISDIKSAPPEYVPEKEYSPGSPNRQPNRKQAVNFRKKRGFFLIAKATVQACQGSAPEPPLSILDFGF